MIKEIAAYGWLDNCWERGDNDARSFASYADWLRSLSDSELLAAYNRVTTAEAQLD
jgi:hypothetical protein